MSLICLFSVRVNKSRFAAIGILVVCLVNSIDAARASDEATKWLMQINDAAANLSFAGNFVYVHDGQVEAMTVARRVRSGVMQERLYALNGEAREVVRDKDRVWCYIPDKNVGVHDYRQTSESGFPRILPADIENLRRNYLFELGDQLRVADRMAQQIKVLPKDQFRYGYHLWADTESGLLLRSDLVDATGESVEQYLFVNIEIGREIADSELESVTSKDQLVWYGMDRPNLTAEVDQGHWQIIDPPAGYRLTRHIRRMTPMEMEEEEHMVFTDGLSSVSIFVKKAKQGQSTVTGLSRMGAVHAYRNTIENHWVTVMGEVPAETVQHLATQISFRP
ncbi:MAG: MucB/RseB C-terminal domain-containing protein [bacterium]